MWLVSVLMCFPQQVHLCNPFTVCLQETKPYLQCSSNMCTLSLRVIGHCSIPLMLSSTPQERKLYKQLSYQGHEAVKCLYFVILLTIKIPHYLKKTQEFTCLKEFKMFPVIVTDCITDSFGEKQLQKLKSLGECAGFFLMPECHMKQHFV